MEICCIFFRVEYLQTLFGIFLLRRFVSTLLTYWSNHLHQCELTDTYFMLWVRIQCNIFVFWNYSNVCHSELFQLAPVYLWHLPIPHQCRVLFCFGCFLTLQVALGSFFVFYVEVLESFISARSSHSFHWRMVLETKIWTLEVLIAVGVLLLLSPLRWQNKEICVCILTSIYTHIYKYFYMQPFVSTLS